MGPLAPVIVAVDQSVINLRLLDVILAKEGFRLLQAHSATEAFPLIVEHKPKLVLMDMVLPDIDGVELCRMMKANSETQDIPSIVITSRSRGADVLHALESGAFDFIKKPLDELEVIGRVRSALRFRDYQNRLMDMAMRDSLTGLYNHALILDLLEKELYNASRRKKPIAFVMADIDHFKSINDNYGHQTGDEVLIATAKLLEGTLRKGDYLGRYGGEEFALILSGLDEADAVSLCERLRKLVETTPVRFQNTEVVRTLSLGISHLVPAENVCAKDLVLAADTALYQAKESGRNRVVLGAFPTAAE